MNTTQRKLTTIFSADVQDYTRLMGMDEEGTLATLKRYRDAMSRLIGAHGGRVINTWGDGLIAEFPSVVEAVRTAVDVQNELAELNGARSAEGRMLFRIGINLGDVIVEGDDIYGDGVNVAARLEPLAEPGGICVSSIVNESVGNRVDVRFQDGGEMSVKNIDRPIRVWKWHPGATPDVTKSKNDKPLPKVATASIAVLPFTNMSGDPEQEYFSDGISDTS